MESLTEFAPCCLVLMRLNQRTNVARSFRIGRRYLYVLCIYKGSCIHCNINTNTHICGICTSNIYMYIYVCIYICMYMFFLLCFYIYIYAYLKKLYIYVYVERHAYIHSVRLRESLWVSGLGRARFWPPVPGSACACRAQMH